MCMRTGGGRGGTTLEEDAHVKAAVAAGIHIAMGSDAVFTMFGENTNELARSIMVRARCSYNQLTQRSSFGKRQCCPIADFVTERPTASSAVSSCSRWVAEGYLGFAGGGGGASQLAL